MRNVLIALVVAGAAGCALGQQADGPPAPPADAKRPAFGALGLGWTYLYADQGAGERESLNGWYVRPSVNLPRHLSLFADFTNYYGANKKGSVNSHGFTGGIQQTLFPKRREHVGLFVEAGDVRVSNAGTIVNQFGFNAGFNVEVPLGKGVSFTVTPAEYIFLYPKGDPRNDYNAKVGISIAVPRL